MTEAVVSAAAAQSPFDANGAQWAWDSTSLGWLKTCPRYYHYSMIGQWRSRAESVHLRFGQHFATAVEHYHKHRDKGMSHNDAVLEVVTEAMLDTWDRTEADPAGKPWTPDHKSKNRFTLIRTIVWYFDRYEDDQAKPVRLSDGKLAVELSGRFYLTDDIMLCFHLDQLVDMAGMVFVRDQKTTGSTLAPYYFDQYAPDNQMSLYTLAGRVVYNVPVKGVVIDAAQVAVGFSRFDRGITYRSQEQLDEWITDTLHYIDMARQFTERGYWPQNDKACGNYGGCAFRKVCGANPRIRDTVLHAEYVKVEWNPLIPR